MWSTPTDLHLLMDGTKPHVASYIAAKREVEWRQDRTHIVLQAATLAISILALIVASLVAIDK
jgi:hypothetical protein